MSGDNQPAVTVIIATYNYGDYIGETLDSVARQTFDDYEVIVIDDGSTDRTAEVVEGQRAQFGGRLQYIQQRNQGVYVARNRGLQQAHGRLIAFLDADDIWHPEALAAMYQFLEEHPDVGMVYANTAFFSESPQQIEETNFGAGSSKRPHTGDCLEALFTEGNFIPLMAALMRREVINRVGLFPGGLRVAGDYDYWLRIACHFPIGYLDRILAYVRRHGSNLTYRSLAQARAKRVILRRLLRCAPQACAKIGEAAIRRRFYQVYYDIGIYLILGGQRRRGRKFLQEAWKLNATPNINYIVVYYLFSFLPGVRFLIRLRDWRRRQRSRGLTGTFQTGNKDA